MNKTELIERVADAAQISKKDAAVVVETTFGTIGTALQKGDKVQLIGFGTFETRQRAERTAKNPRTGEVIKVAATVVPSFKPGKALKEAINK